MFSEKNINFSLVDFFLHLKLWHRRRSKEYFAASKWGKIWQAPIFLIFWFLKTVELKLSSTNSQLFIQFPAARFFSFTFFFRHVSRLSTFNSFEFSSSERQFKSAARNGEAHPRRTFSFFCILNDLNFYKSADFCELNGSNGISWESSWLI